MFSENSTYKKKEYIPLGSVTLTREFNKEHSSLKQDLDNLVLKNKDLFRIFESKIPIFEQKLNFIENGKIVTCSSSNDPKMSEQILKSLSKETKMGEFTQKMLLNILYNASRPPTQWKWDIEMIVIYLKFIF